jgi:hypothetical protein
MTNSPSGAMPGAFNFSQPHRDNGSAPQVSGAKSHIFQPPRTPSASASSSLILTRSTASVMSISTTGGNERPKFAPRKRTLHEYNDGGTETPRNGYMDASNDWDVREDGTVKEGWMPGSPKPLVNTRYALAGGMDTPGQLFAQAMESSSEYNDIGYRKSLSGDDRGETRTTRRGLWGEHEGSNYFEMGREGNGRGRYSGGFNNSPGEGWGKAAIQVAGAVVGKLWDFCKTSGAVFKGFNAGGGQSYKVTSDNSRAQFEAVDESNFWVEKNGYSVERDSTPLPGQYPAEADRELDFIPDYMDHATRETTPPRPSKRRQISSNHDSELTKNWVVVPPTTSTPAKAQPKGPARYSMPTASSASRRSIAANSSAHRPASRAGFTSSAANPRRPGLSRVSHAGSPALNINRGASFASPRSPASESKIPLPRASTMGSPTRGTPSATGMGAVMDSPAAKEAQRWAALKKKEEREADESIRRLDRQLKAMIRQGKEALGTKIEVEIDDDDLEFSSGVGTKKWAF